MRLRIKIDGKTYEAEVEILDSQESAPEYPPYPPALTTFVPATLPEPAIHVEPERNEGKECRSPVTGMVIKVNVEPGQEVQPDEVVVVLESMKMEMQITAPRGGLVKRVAVAPGAAVKVDELMVEFV
ncbi:MAG TPA: biotin/lipoyl-containing protein [Terracidiphilus sp.]|nr:biotin/lipoyl-containing protein [Terracidiphilus sp.]